MIQQNGFVGVNVAGIQSQPRLLYNIIRDNQGPGVLVGVCNQAKVRPYSQIENNSIIKNQSGVHVNSGHAKLLKNKIYDNYENGVTLAQHEDFRSHAVLDKNEICCNLGHGVQCQGSLNFPVIQKNNLVGLNHLCGIHVSAGCHAVVNQNFIANNSTPITQ